MAPDQLDEMAAAEAMTNEVRAERGGLGLTPIAGCCCHGSNNPWADGECSCQGITHPDLAAARLAGSVRH